LNSPQQKIATFDDLPAEMQLEVFSYLDPPDIANVRRVDKVRDEIVDRNSTRIYLRGLTPNEVVTYAEQFSKDTQRKVIGAFLEHAKGVEDTAARQAIFAAIAEHGDDGHRDEVLEELTPEKLPDPQERSWVLASIATFGNDRHRNHAFQRAMSGEFLTPSLQATVLGGVAEKGNADHRDAVQRAARDIMNLPDHDRLWLLAIAGSDRDRDAVLEHTGPNNNVLSGALSSAWGAVARHGNREHRSKILSSLTHIACEHEDDLKWVLSNVAKEATPQQHDKILDLATRIEDRHKRAEVLASSAAHGNGQHRDVVLGRAWSEEFPDPKDRALLLKKVAEHGNPYQRYKVLKAAKELNLRDVVETVTVLSASANRKNASRARGR
jgi:hypothetical protein